jgi:hypothetical protein
MSFDPLGSGAAFGIGSPFAAILPYLEQQNLRDILSPDRPWYLESSTVAQMVISVYLCPSDTGPYRHSIPLFDVLGLPVGSIFGSNSYGLSKGVNDALCFSLWFGAPPITAESGMFDFNAFRGIADIGDGSSNTFMIGEGATGYPLCHGIGCMTQYQNYLSVDNWLFGGQSQPAWVNQGFVYPGNKCSTVERLNKAPVTDAVIVVPQAFNCTPSFRGGPHWTTNFRSFHPGGGLFLYADGSTRWTKDTIAMPTYRALSTIRGGELLSNE